MSTIDQIRQHISELPPHKLFTTRDLLNYGTRSAVDNAIHKLVKFSEIVRVVPGVFRSPHRNEIVGITELAQVKAKSFGRTIVSYAEDVAIDLGLVVEQDANGEFFFATDGRTSSFRFGPLKIHLKGTSPRKMALGDSRVGKTIRALCYLGQERVSDGLIELATSWLTESEREESGSLCAFMPAWLSSFFCVFFKRPVSAIRHILLYDDPNQDSSRLVKELLIA